MRLDLGSSDRTWNAGEGWTRVDVSETDIIQDLSKFPWQFEDNSIEDIFASHMLEHLTHDDGYSFMAECYRILKPGGSINLAVPDMDIFITCLLKDDWTPLEYYPHRDMNKLCAGGTGIDNPWSHKYMYNWETIAYMLKAYGFVDITAHDFEDGLFNIHNPKHKPQSLYVYARKPK